MRISVWSSDVCSSDLLCADGVAGVVDNIELGCRQGLARRLGQLDAALVGNIDDGYLVVDFSFVAHLLQHAYYAVTVRWRRLKQRKQIVPALDQIAIGRASCRARVCQYV